MYAIKCNPGEIEAIKRHLLDKGLMNKEFLPKRDHNGFYFPIIKKTKDSVEVAEDFFERKETVSDLKSMLKKDFTEDELKRIKTAYDIVGSIAILEIDDEFSGREKLIADAVLKQNKQVKTVLSKSGIHEGTYRTQKMRFLAGEDTRETTYLENGAKIKLNVETVYFSSRLSEERKRIAGQVRKGESVIEMFSGCAPYATVISKNTGAKEICGIEINPDGHWYGMENIAINKLGNVRLFCGDAKKLVPRINNLGIGLKGGIDNFSKIYSEGLQLFELQLEKNELDDRYDEVSEFIDSLSEKGVSVMVHHIMKYHDADTSLCTENITELDAVVERFLSLCKKRNVIGFALHSTNHKDTYGLLDEESEACIDKISKNLNHLFRKYKSERIQDLLYMENSIYAINTFAHFKEIKKRTGLKNVVLDDVHLFVSNIMPLNLVKNPPKSTDYVKYRKAISDFKANFNVYFHIADTSARVPPDKDAIEIGKGIIDFTKVADLIDFGVIEVWDYFSKDPIENKRSHKAICALRDKILGKKTFDRILMPLPKSAEDFLDDALAMAKDGTIIHFYDFLNEQLGEIPGKAIEKIDKACKRNKISYEVLGHVKCGDHAPHTYRVCVDFKISKSMH